MDAGLSRVLNRWTVSRPPCSFEGKCTFLGVEGEVGADWVRVWFVELEGREEDTLGVEEDDFRDDFRGFPLERRMGVGAEEAYRRG